MPRKHGVTYIHFRHSQIQKKDGQTKKTGKQNKKEKLARDKSSNRMKSPTGGSSNYTLGRRHFVITRQKRTSILYFLE